MKNHLAVLGIAAGALLHSMALAQPDARALPLGAPAAVAALDNAKLGNQAVAAWREGFKTGDFSKLVEMFDDNIEFRLGIPPYNTIQQGKAQAISAFQFFQGLNIRVDQIPLTPLMFNGYSTTFEFQATGTVNFAPAEANLLVVFDILHGKIVRLREYPAPAAP